MSRKRSKRPHSPPKIPATSTGEGRREERKASSGSAEGSGPQPFFSAAGLRELVESVVIAFVLAFLFRTFEAEAFVIPTGSMAPTLMGRHKDVICPECGYAFQVSASDEMDNNTGVRNNQDVVSGTCPMCRYTMDLGPGNLANKTYPSYKGDRILVSKFAYRFAEPQRWDVAVFKYPGGAKTNFIKRLVGLPNETLAISHGDLFVKPLDPETDFVRFGEQAHRSGDVSIDLREFRIARKSPEKVKAVLQPVYDNDCAQPKLIEAGWPARWSPRARPDLTPGWRTSEDYRSFHVDGTADEDVWITYRHIVPLYQDWQDLKNPSLPAGRKLEEQLITDFSAYNTEVARYADYDRNTGNHWDPHGGYDPYGAIVDEHSGLPPDGRVLGLHWVGDLAVECNMEVEGPGGEAVFELVEGGRVFQCRIDVATGTATLWIDGLEEYRPTAATRVRRPGTYRIMFANVDDQLLLWVNGKVVRFDAETGYPHLDNTRPQDSDLEPVRIGSRGAALAIRHLKLYRDIYYIAQRLAPVSYNSPITDFDSRPYRNFDPGEVAAALSDPEGWSASAECRQVAFPLGEDQFLVLGDNSAESKDGRLWENEHYPNGERFPHYVSRELLMGKALFIYWPHSLDKIPYTNIPIRFLPNLARMHFVR